MQDFYRYLSEVDVHVLDCAGRVDVATGLQRLRVLHRKLAERPPTDGVVRLLVDFRGTTWESEDAHRELSRASRDEVGLFSGNNSVRVAFVHQLPIGRVSDNEHWFSSSEAALDWLAQSR